MLRKLNTGFIHILDRYTRVKKWHFIPMLSFLEFQIWLLSLITIRFCRQYIRQRAEKRRSYIETLQREVLQCHERYQTAKCYQKLCRDIDVFCMAPVFSAKDTIMDVNKENAQGMPLHEGAANNITTSDKDTDQTSDENSMHKFSRVSIIILVVHMERCSWWTDVAYRVAIKMYTQCHHLTHFLSPLCLTGSGLDKEADSEYIRLSALSNRNGSNRLSITCGWRHVFHGDHVMIYFSYNRDDMKW